MFLASCSVGDGWKFTRKLVTAFSNIQHLIVICGQCTIFIQHKQRTVDSNDYVKSRR